MYIGREDATMPDYAQQRGTDHRSLTTPITPQRPAIPTDRPERTQAQAYVQGLPPPPPPLGGALTHSCAHPFSCCSAFDFVRSLNAFNPRGRSSVGDSGGVASQPNAWPVFVNAVVVVAAVGGGVEAADAALAALLLKGARCCGCGKERFSMSDSAERVASAD